MKRTHTCGELTIKNVGEKAALLGWVDKRRDHGKLIFIDLRDRYGITQIVFFKNKDAVGLRNEYVIGVIGIVQERPKGTENPEIATGQIELASEALEIINPSLTPAFELNEYANVSEEVRLKYRFIDLRRPEAQQKFILRHRICKAIRDFLDKEGFLEIETPILTKSTPEGARDFLVPSRMNPGKFFALPQSPQLFKQLLMVSGFERYFQIARCFRDEDLRADRQLEFTQLDMEMSFIEEEDIFNITEKLFYYLFKEVLQIELEIPFKRISYKEAMDTYGVDKPDLRKEKKGFGLVWVLDFPLFKYNDEEKRWDMEHHPFTSPLSEDIGLIDSSPEKVRARAYDLVINGVEIASGSIRIHQRELQEKIFRCIGMDSATAKERFGFLLEAFTYGAPPHGGIAFGLDRLIALMCGSDSIRDVIAFPKTQKGICPLTDAPSWVAEKQLKELGIIKAGGSMNTLKSLLFVLCAALFLSSCVMRTTAYEVDRVDQELTGNRGVIYGTPPEAEDTTVTKTRMMYDVEIELPSFYATYREVKKHRMADKELYGNRGYIQGGPAPEKEIYVPKESESSVVRLGNFRQVPQVVYSETSQSQAMEAAFSTAKAEFYTVKKGDTLQKISNNIYGTTKRWKDIYDLNKDLLKSPDRIRPGQKLAIPKE